MLVLEGEAGVGKTTLWSCGIEAARERSFRVLASSPSEAEARLSFAALGDLLGEVVPDALPELPPPQRRALEVALLLEGPDGPPSDQRAVAVAVLGVLRALATQNPVVVAVDDVQWLDAASATVLEFAARRVRHEPVAFLLAERRDAAPGDRPRLAQMLPEGRLRRVPVPPLSLGALHRLLNERLATALPRPTLRKVHELSGGNPFFALEIARALARGDLRLAPGEPLLVPPSLRELVRSRLGALPAETRETLRVAAALSQPTIDLVAAACGGRASLGPAVDVGVVELDGERIRFGHPLLASAAYSTIEPGFRRALHRRLADVVGEPEERARHLALAASGPAADVAAELDAAVTRARARGASAAAAELAEKARDLTPLDDVDARGRRALAAGRHWFEAGDTAAALALLDGAVRNAPPGPRRAEMLAALARIHLYEGDQVLATDLARRASEEAGSDPEARSRAESITATALFFRRKDLAEAERRARKAVRFALRAGNARLAAIVMRDEAMIRLLRGDPDASESYERAAALGEAVEYGQVIEEPSFHRAVVLLWTDGFEEAAAQLRSARRRAEERGDEGSLPLVLAMLALAECMLGDWEAAGRASDEGYEVALQTGQRPQQVFTLAARALLAAYRGQVEAARASAAKALERAGGRGSTGATMIAVSALGLLELSLGRPDEAHRHLGPVVQYVDAEGIAEPGVLRFVFDDVEALIALGLPADAEATLARVERESVRLDRASGLAASARCRGLLAASAGDVEGASAAFEAALAAHDRVPMPFERARTLLALGVAHRRAKRKRAAREALDEALAVFERLGAPLWAERARAELGRIGGRGPARGVLTPTERRVAELVAEGRSNKEVASALFVTERTVEANLSKVYAKLGLRSRTELVRLIARG